MFGYGSLINTISRLSSSPQANNVIPCVVSSKANLKRLWNYRARPKGSQVGAKFVALGVEKTKPGEGTDMNGIVYPLSKGTTMDQIREREKGYEFIHIKREHITEYATVLCWQKIPKDAEIWMCGPALDPAYVCEPSAPFPILQTYVDVCISGCLEHDIQFAEMFVATTTGWSEYFLNDREVPRRPWVSKLHSQQDWKRIDTILGDDLLKFRTLTGEYGAIHGQDLALDFKSTHKRLSLLGPKSRRFSHETIFDN